MGRTGSFLTGTLPHYSIKKKLMLKKIIFITYLFHCTAVHAQQENNTHARIIKITAADSLVTLSKPLKTRLQKAAADKKIIPCACLLQAVTRLAAAMYAAGWLLKNSRMFTALTWRHW
jgi:hypothetical protein